MAIPPLPPGYRLRPQPPPNIADALGRPVIQAGPPVATPQTGAETAASIASAGERRASAARTTQTIRQNPINEKDQLVIGDLRNKASQIDDVINNYRTASTVIQRFNTSPEKAYLLEKGVPPPQDSSLWQQARGMVMGAPKTPIVTQQDRENYQEIKRLQNLYVLAEQQKQAGPQTESDAARMALTAISPGNYKNVNAKILADGMISAQLAKRKPGFYTRWANRYGSLSAVSPNGTTVDDAWNAMAEDARNRNRARGLPGQAAPGPAGPAAAGGGDPLGIRR